MKKIILTFVTTLLLFGSFSFAEIYQSNISSLLDDFDVRSAINNMQDLQDSVDVITQELYALDDKERVNGNISQKYRETRWEIVNVIQTINSTTQAAASMLKKILVYKKQILLSQKELKVINYDLKVTKKYLMDFTNFMYKFNNTIYSNGTDQIDELKLLIQSENIPQTLASSYSITSLILQFNELIEVLDKQRIQQESLIKKLNKLKISTKNQVKNYDQELEKLQQKKNYLVHFIQLYKNDRFRDQSTFDNIFNSIKDVHLAINAFVGDVEKWNYKSSIDMEDKIEKLRISEKDSPDEDHPIAWPIYPIYHIDTLFADKNFESEYGVPHQWIQIAAKQWNTVYAARDGIAYHVVNNEWVWINRMLIVHNNGYITSYRYMNKIFVKEGDIIKRWQVLWTSGGEPWTVGAWFISDNANLTFGVYKDGIPIDPLTILDLSVVIDKNILPENYRIKYLKDKFARPIDITELTFMEWDTELQRMDKFLDLYGVGIYKQVSFWQDAAEGTNIDVAMLICTAFAESTLGRHLTTPNNVGNVWNTDSDPHAQSFGSALVGAREIANTMNNRYLGHYNTIKDLSRYWNDNGKIYASSSFNRQNNILKCQSQIKWYYVPEDYPFRTGPNPRLEELKKLELANILSKSKTP